MKMKPYKKIELSQNQYIAVGFVLMILLGALILMLPISSRSGEWTDPLSAFFTATSASCVTGLVVVDTYTHWSLFGQLIILTLIQVGGLGFMTVGMLFAIVMRRNIELKSRRFMQESVSALQLSGIVKLVRKIFFGTCLIEGSGAVLLSLYFIPRMGFVQGIYYSIFHAISAFCNAGFDLMGQFEEYSSFVSCYDNVLVNVVFVGLILLGGLGFFVWDDLTKNGLHVKKYQLHTKMVLIGSLILTVGGWILMYLFEYNVSFAGMDTKGRILSALFASVTPRTAGFNTTDTGALSPAGQILSLFLMLVGGNSGSTAGGVKVTTIMVLFLFVWANIRQSDSVEIFNRRLSDETVRKASVVVTINLSLAVLSAMVICAMQPLELEDVLFETFSAISTVGMTRNLTRELGTASRIIIMLLMYCGRIGSMTFALSFVRKKDTAIIKSPVGEISVG